MLFCVLYHTHINFHHNYTNFQKLSLCRCKYNPCLDIELHDHCFALPCECVPIGILMKEGKGELKHFNNLMKENEIFTIKCVEKYATMINHLY